MEHPHNSKPRREYDGPGEQAAVVYLQLPKPKWKRSFEFTEKQGYFKNTCHLHARAKLAVVSLWSNCQLPESRVEETQRASYKNQREFDYTTGKNNSFHHSFRLAHSAVKKQISHFRLFRIIWF